MIIILCLIIVWAMVRLYIDHRWIKKTYYNVSSYKIPASFEGFKILQLTDLHNRSFGTRLIEMIDEEKPDIVIMTGDMVSSNTVNFQKFLDFAKDISARYPVYYIKGNHEGRMELEDYQVIADALKIYGVCILDNEKVVISQKEDSISLYGLWVNQRYYSRASADKKYVLTKKLMTKLLGNPNHKEYNILLVHTPSYFTSYEEWGADLVFCGHVHGGLIRLPLVGGLLSPDRTFFPKYDYGKYEKRGTTLILSSGLSAGETLFRFWNRPEIVVVTLHHDAQ